MTGFAVNERHGEWLSVQYDGVELCRYVYEPHNAQLESPHPYFHPMRTLDGALVSLYRPHDHVWHKGLSLALPNVDDANFWGGPTFVRDKGYQQLPNNGTQQHREFGPIHCSADGVEFDESLVWITEQGEEWFDEQREVAISLVEDGWRLTFATALHNLRESTIRFGSPTTEGRPMAGYGGLFWRGPRSFNKGQILASAAQSGPEMMGQRAEWLAYVGKHDGVGGAATVVFVDHSSNPRYPTKWFVRDDPYACVSPAPFFDEVLELPAGQALRLRYDVLIGTTEWDAERIEKVR